MTKEIEPLKRGKLTKKFLMDLPDNVFLVSNLFKRENASTKKFVPVFTEKVMPLPKRIYQWQKIKEASADQRLCHVFKTEKDAEKWLKQMFSILKNRQP